jgi:hypothetical protein
MLIVFFDMKRTVNYEFVPPNTMVNSDFWLLLWHFEMLETKCVTKKTRTLAQPRQGGNGAILGEDGQATAVFGGDVS